MDNRVKVLESAKTTMSEQISNVVSVADLNKTDIANLTTRVTTVEGTTTSHGNRITSLENKVNAIDVAALSNRIEVVKLGGKTLDIDSSDKSVNIAEISTDLLKQGNKTLVLDCLNASLTDENL
jgi:hypothetical protein